jgi:hypothetical protein
MKKHGKMKPAPGKAVDILLGEAQKIETYKSEACRGGAIMLQLFHLRVFLIFET